MRIGILGEPTDAEADLVAKRLREAGVEPVFADVSGFPAKSRLSLHVDGPRPRVEVDGQDASDVRAWYVRRFGYVDPLFRGELTREAWNDIYGQFREWGQVENQKAMTVASLLRFLEELAPMVNSPDAFIGHNRKPHQVYLLRKAGLPVPDFLASNDPDAIRAFLARHPRVIYKPVAGGRHTREIDAAHFESRVKALATEPILVQALAEGRHCRAYVVGDRFVGAGEILFDREAGIDYRASTKGAERIDLPAHVQAQCVQAAQACGMSFTGLDVIWDEPTGTHRFLECNPSAMFVNFERMTGVPVSTALVDHLVERAKLGR